MKPKKALTFATRNARNVEEKQLNQRQSLAQGLTGSNVRTSDFNVRTSEKNVRTSENFTGSKRKYSYLVVSNQAHCFRSWPVGAKFETTPWWARPQCFFCSLCKQCPVYIVPV